MSGGINPAMFASGKDGAMPADNVAASLHDALTTGNWDGKQDAVTAVLPFVNVAVGQKMPNGNTITGVQVTHLMYDPKDPKYLHYTLAGDHQDDNGGNRGTFSTPHFSDDHKIPIDALNKGIQQFTSAYQLAKDPRFQQKLGESVVNNDHALGDYMRVAARAGQIPPSAAIKSVPGGFVSATPGEKPTFTRTLDPKITTATQRQQFINVISDSNSSDDEKQEAIDSLAAMSAAEHGFSTTKDPNLRSTRMSSLTPDEYDQSIDARVKSGNMDTDEAEFLKNQYRAHKAGVGAPSTTVTKTTPTAGGGKSTTKDVKPGPKPKTPPAPKVGTVQGGYQFKGGDPSKKENWKKV
jgi:hypothetical protein